MAQSITEYVDAGVQCDGLGDIPDEVDYELDENFKDDVSQLNETEVKQEVLMNWKLQKNLKRKKTIKRGKKKPKESGDTTSHEPKRSHRLSMRMSSDTTVPQAASTEPVKHEQLTITKEPDSENIEVEVEFDSDAKKSNEQRELTFETDLEGVNSEMNSPGKKSNKSENDQKCHSTPLVDTFKNCSIFKSKLEEINESSSVKITPNSKTKH